MDPVTLTALLTAIAAVGGTTKAWYEAKKARMDYTAAMSKVDIALRDGGEPTTEEDRRAVQPLVIDPEFLERMVEEMQTEQAKLNAVVRTIPPPEQMEAAMREAREILCKHLKIIKEYNDNQLPEGYRLHEMWASNNCAQP